MSTTTTKAAAADDPGSFDDPGSHGNEYESSTERINNSLQKIRTELTEIRDQDLKLLKQLIQISGTIKKLSEDRLSKRRTWYGQRQSLCSESAELYLDIEPLTPDLEDYRDAILVRQFSEPVSFSRDDLLDMKPSLSIFEAPISLDNNDTMDQSWPPNFSRVQLRHRPHSVSILTSSRSFGMDSSQEWMEGNEKSYEEILERNIRLWKVRHSVHTSDDDEEDRARTPVNDWSLFTTNGHKSPVSLAELDTDSSKRKRDSGSSCSSVINSSGSSYGSSAVNGGSSRSSCSSCSSCIFSGGNIGILETLAPDVSENSCSDGGSVVTENSRSILTCVAEPAENDVSLDNGDVVDGRCSNDIDDFRDTKECRDGGGVDEPSFCNDGEERLLIDFSEPVNELVQCDSGRTGEESGDKGADGGIEIGMTHPDGGEKDVRGGNAGSIGEDTMQIRLGVEEIAGASSAGIGIGTSEKGCEIGIREEERRGEGSEMKQEESERGRPRERDKGSDRAKDGGAGAGDKSKRKDSGSSGGGVVRALLDHIGRKIENRVTVGMAEYSRSFLPVISEMSKKDGRQKAGSHRPRELDIT